MAKSLTRPSKYFPDQYSSRFRFVKIYQSFCRTVSLLLHTDILLNVRSSSNYTAETLASSSLFTRPKTMNHLVITVRLEQRCSGQLHFKLAFWGVLYRKEIKSCELVEREVIREDGILMIILFTSETGDTIHKYIVTI